MAALAISVAPAGPAYSVSLLGGCGGIYPGSNCDTDNTGDDVTVTVDDTWLPDPPDDPRPPTHDDPNSDGNGGGGGDGTGDNGGNDPVNTPFCVWESSVFLVCPDGDDDDETEDEPDEPEPPTVVHASDVLSFAPPTPTITSEPDGVGIVGMPLNVVVPSAPSSSSGSLLGFDVTVSFVPELLEIDYGDGTAVEVDAATATWDDLGQAEFTATSTSHAYSERGKYTITANVLSSATVEFVGYGTIPVTGLVRSPAATTSVRAVTADTALVAQTCAENPSGPAC
ncbi:hypothetical protein [Microbacterium halophytorum]|uniref:hypothetical protein n=1 Tax=Microbacterium halophytorum TaxID=2067568 RepID=UPI000CFCDB42|nr:hypothetical protein [Microbacterium halophytorum]